MCLRTAKRYYEEAKRDYRITKNYINRNYKLMFDDYTTYRDGVYYLCRFVFLFIRNGRIRKVAELFGACEIREFKMSYKEALEHYKYLLECSWLNWREDEMKYWENQVKIWETNSDWKW